MWIPNAIALFLAFRLARADDFNITKFNAAASPILVTGKTRSFVEFYMTVPGNSTPGRCYNWAETKDSTIQGTSTTECQDNEAITWSFEAAETTGFDLNIFWSYAASEGLFGSHHVKPDELEWASSEGIDIQFYSGPSEFVIANVSSDAL